MVVLENGELVGIVTGRDLRHVVVRAKDLTSTNLTSAHADLSVVAVGMVF